MLGVTRRQVGRFASTALVVSALSWGLSAPSVIAQGAEPPPEPPEEPAPEPDIAVGEVDGTTVAVAAPPVPAPPTSVQVAVGQPPVPPTTVVVAVGQPPVPPTTQVAATPSFKPAAVVNRPEPDLALRRVSDAARQVTVGLAELSDLL